MLGAATIALPAAGRSGDILRTLDPDRDGTVDSNEAKTQASALFDRLDRDHDGTLDRRELRGRLSAKQLPLPIRTTMERCRRRSISPSSRSVSRPLTQTGTVRLTARS
jgi:Ca2+-binding EF-hand superfamily protein